MFVLILFWFLPFYINAHTTLNELLAVFLYIIFAVLLKFERSLNSYLICTTTTTTTKLSSSRHQCKISLTYVNWPKNPLQTQKSCRYFLQRPSYSPFCFKFRCHGNGVGEQKCNWQHCIQWPIAENTPTDAKISQISRTQTEL